MLDPSIILASLPVAIALIEGCSKIAEAILKLVNDREEREAKQKLQDKQHAQEKEIIRSSPETRQRIRKKIIEANEIKYRVGPIINETETETVSLKKKL